MRKVSVIPALAVWLACLFLAIPVAHASDYVIVSVEATGKDRATAENNALVAAVRKTLFSLADQQLLTALKDDVRRKFILKSRDYARVMMVTSSYESGGITHIAAEVEVDKKKVMTNLMEPELVNALVRQGVVFILVPQKDGLGIGSGFLIGEDLILTNRHVVSNAKGQVGKDIIIFSHNVKRPMEAKVLGVSKAPRDYALLKAPQRLTRRPLVFSPNVRQTDRVSAWGFPGFVLRTDPRFQRLLKGEAVEMPEVVYSSGEVSVLQDQQPPIIIHTAIVSQGNSGGPLVDKYGRIVGINTWIAVDQKSNRQSNVAINASDIIKFLKANDIPFGVGDF